MSSEPIEVVLEVRRARLADAHREVVRLEAELRQARSEHRRCQQLWLEAELSAQPDPGEATENDHYEFGPR